MLGCIKRCILGVSICCIERVCVPAAIFFPEGGSLSAWFWKFNVVPSLAFTFKRYIKKKVQIRVKLGLDGRPLEVWAVIYHWYEEGGSSIRHDQ